MNNCVFTGYLVENPISSYQGNVLKVEFIIVTYTYRTVKKTGEKTRIPTYIHCEAWHTGAETIEKNTKAGTKITIQSSAKHYSQEDEALVFRVNEFDICDHETQEENW